MAVSSVVSSLKTYSLPLILLSFAIFVQLFVIPSTFPPPHYDVLGVNRYSSIEEVAEAYEKLSSKWYSGVEEPETIDFLKIRYAFELLTNQVWKRDYDVFAIDEQLHILEKLKEKYAGEAFSNLDVPILDAPSSDLFDNAFNMLTTEEFQRSIGGSKAWLIQVYSSGSSHSSEFSNNWKRIANLLDGVASTGTVELGEVELAMYLAERKSTGQPFRNGLPSLVAFPSGCRSLNCLVRYQGDLSVDAVTDWFATNILGLPRILYYSKETLGQNFIAKSGHHKVRVICFSRTGERAAPFLRQAAKDYWAYASFAFVLWREDESSIWWNTFEVESAPAFVFMKDPGAKPVVIHGEMNSSSFSNIMEQNKQQGLPQLRSITSQELGCDSRGYARAGYEAVTWYCVILAGRPSLELNKMRETMLRVQDTLSNDGKSNADDKDNISAPPAAAALKEKRLTFTWLDGEAQQKYCFFYIHSETSYETCGPRRDITDVPQLVIVRYTRNSTKNETKVEKKRKTIWDTFQEEDENLAAQLVARYNGSSDIPEIIQWVSQIVKDGDSTDLPFFRAKTPDLIPEDSNPIWSSGTQKVYSTSRGLKQTIQKFITNMYDRIGDPRLGPMLLLGAMITFGSIFLQRSRASSSTQRSQSSQPSQSSQSSQSSQPIGEEPEKPKARRRTRAKQASGKDRAPSITDDVPRDAFQIIATDSDSD